MDDERCCADCGEPTQISWNGGRCWNCHDARCAFPLTGDVAPAGFDPLYAGERWSEDDPW